jgi:hypothetical protein
MRGTVILIGVAAIRAGGNAGISVRAGFAVHDKFTDVIVFRIQIGTFGSVNLRTVYEIDGNKRTFIFAIFILLANDDKALSDGAAIGAFFDGIAVLVNADVIPSTTGVDVAIEDGFTNGTIFFIDIGVAETVFIKIDPSVGIAMSLGRIFIGCAANRAGFVHDIAVLAGFALHLVRVFILVLTIVPSVLARDQAGVAHVKRKRLVSSVFANGHSFDPLTVNHNQTAFGAGIGAGIADNLTVFVPGIFLNAVSEHAVEDSVSHLLNSAADFATVNDKRSAAGGIFGKIEGYVIFPSDVRIGISVKRLAAHTADTGDLHAVLAGFA